MTLKEMLNQLKKRKDELLAKTTIDEKIKEAVSRPSPIKEAWQSRANLPLGGRIIGTAGEMGAFGPLIQAIPKITQKYPQTAMPISHFAAGLSPVIPAEKIALGQSLPEKEKYAPYRLAGGITGGLVTGGPKLVLGAATTGGVLGGGAQAISNIAKGKPVFSNVGKSVVESAKYGAVTSPTFALTNAAVEKIATTLPALKPLTEKGIQKTLPKSSQTLGQWASNLGKTGLKRVVKAALIETPIEGLTYGVKDIKDNQKLIDSIADQTAQNFLFNVGMAGVNTAANATSIFPILKKSFDDAFASYQALPRGVREGGYVRIRSESKINVPKSEPVKIIGKEFEVTPPEGMKKRGFYETLEETKTSPDVLGRMPEESVFYRVYSNKEAIADAEKILNEVGWEKAKKIATKGELNKTNIALGELMAKKAIDSNQIDEAADIIKEMTKRATTSGQSTQAFSLWSRLTPEGMLKYAEKTISDANERFDLKKLLGKHKDVSLSNDERQLIVDYMRKANVAESLEDQNRYVKLALEVINDKIPWGANEILDMYRYNNMLSNPRSTLRNLYGNLYNTLISKPSVLGVEEGPKSLIKYYAGLAKSIPDAFDDFVEAMKGEGGINVAKGEMSIEDIRSKKAPLAISHNLRFMDAQDKFFRRLIAAGEEATGKSPEEALKSAEYWLYRLRSGDKEAQGWMLNSIDKISEGIASLGYKFKPIRWFVPFLQTPFNVAKMQLEFSPVGFANLINASNKKDEVVKASLGSLVMLLGAKAAAEGRTTWTSPTDPEEKKYFYATGRKPMSVEIGGKYVPFTYFGPYALALAIPAASRYYHEQDPNALSDDGMKKLTDTLSSIVYYWSQQTPFTGLSMFTKILEGDLDYNVSRNLGFTASQLIPESGLQNFVAQILDPIYRKPKGFVEQVKSGIPFLSKTVEQTYTEPTGEPSRRTPLDIFPPYSIGVTSEETKKFEPFYQERMKERQTTRYVNTLAKKIESGEPLSDKEMSLVFGEEATAGGKETFGPLIERAKLEQQYKQANPLFDLYLRSPDEQTSAKILNSVSQMGVDPNDWVYENLAKLPVAQKTEYVLAILEDTPGEQVMEQLAQLRRRSRVSASQILSDSVIDNLYNRGIISASQKKYLKNIDWDEKTGSFVSGGGGTKKSVKITGTPTLKFPEVSAPPSAPKVKITVPSLSLQTSSAGQQTIRPLTRAARVATIKPESLTDIQQRLRQGISYPKVKISLGRRV